MSELVKTLIYVGVAAAALIAAFLIRPPEFDTKGAVEGDKIFPRFDDASRAKVLEIVRYDAASDEISRLKIADKAGQWVIASHNDYPADAKDAEERIRNAAIDLMDLEVLGVATSVTGEHAKFGVVAPSEKQLQEGQEGVGVLISMRDAGGGKLAELVVGKPVRGQTNQHFVRQPSQTVVYAVAFDDEKMSTNFKDWIQPDLLQLNSADISQVTLKDYSFDQQLVMLGNGQGRVIPKYEERLEVAADWNADEWKWKLNRFMENRDGQLAESKFLEGEELNTQKLDDLKNALDQLEIINVESKPQGLGAGLELTEEMDEKIVQSLMLKGFYPVQMRGDDGVTLLSSDGEIVVDAKDGVEYVLRFGKISGMEAKDESTKLNRYLLVTARLDEKGMTAPELAPLPGDIFPTETAPGETAPPAEGGPAAAAPEESSGLNRRTYFTALQAEAEAEKGAGAEPPTAPTQPPVTPPIVAPETSDPAAAEGARIQAENDKKLADFEAKKKKAEDRVAELNKRFGPWYYVISEDVYRKIHLGRFDLIKEKGQEGSTNVDAFRTMESEGLKIEPPPAAPGGEMPEGFHP